VQSSGTSPGAERGLCISDSEVTCDQQYLEVGVYSLGEMISAKPQVGRALNVVVEDSKCPMEHFPIPVL
jgi:hypothetical protein